EHDEGAVPSELEDRLLEMASADFADVLAHRSRSGKHMSPWDRVLEEVVADRRDLGDGDVEEASGQPRFFEDLGHDRAAGDGRLLMRLHHDTIASGERRHYRLEAQEEGEVERADDTDDPERLPVDEVLGV